jgi:hypothetical protein
MAARISVAAIDIFTRTRSIGRCQQAHHQSFEVECVFMAKSLSLIAPGGKMNHRASPQSRSRM